MAESQESAAAVSDEARATKYTQEEINALGAKGHAFKNPDGHYSYPVDDADDLDDAIQAVGRSGAEHDSVRKYILGRADAMGLKDKIPSDWNSDGSLQESGEAKSRPARASDEVRAARDDMRGCRETRAVPISGFEMREVPNGTGGSNLLFTGYASVTCANHDDEAHAYEMEDWLGPWTESIVRGAFQKTISENADVAFLVNHGGVTMARTKPGNLKLTEDLTGLYVEATLNPKRSDVQILRAAVDDGNLDEMSFAFRVTRQEWNEDYSRRWITEVNLDKGDVSPVNYGANPHTGGLVTMRSAVAVMAARGVTRDSFAAALTELRVGKTISAATLDSLQPIYDYLDGAAGHATSLATVLGLDAEEPDDEEEEASSVASVLDYLSLTDHTTAAKQKLAARRAA